MKIVVVSPGMSRITYFSYGSNMSVKRLMDRVPSAEFKHVAILPEHRLAFHKCGRDGSAKCDIHHTRLEHDVVFGVVFSLLASEMPMLDEKEGLGKGYEKKIVEVQHAEGGGVVEALTYYATHVDSSLKPYYWYKEHVLVGAREAKLPEDYVRSIEMVDAIADSDYSRHLLELSIYD
jgi:hypothetical protein